MSTSSAQVAHIVFFSLHDNSRQAQEKLVAACKKYLTDHPGTVYFSAGIRGEDFQRPVNDKLYDVALHVVFGSKADHDRYQEADRHTQFIEENKANWKQVRVFDSVV
jgi:hypothetical protein